MLATADANDALHDATKEWLVVLLKEEQLNEAHEQ
jgi:hypothetical protein